jgi:pimeloyl-ACP methyl ester carboxylesterase
MKSFIFRNHRVLYLHKGQGPPLIMLHNGGNDHRIWDYQIDFFKHYFEIFALDLLGYGLSDKPDIEYTLNLYTQLLDHFIQTNKLEQISLLGHCIGSATALSYTLTHPETVRYLIMMNTATMKTLLAGDLGKLYQWVQSSIVARQLLKILSVHLSLPGWVHQRCIQLQYGLESELDALFMNHLIKRYQDPAQLSALYQLLLNFKSFSSLDTIEKPKAFPPTFIIWGGQNNILPVKGGRVFAEHFKPDRFQIFTQGGHMVMRDCSRWVNQSLFNFFNDFKRV